MRMQMVQARQEQQEREGGGLGKQNEGQMKEVPFSIEDYRQMRGLQGNLKQMKNAMVEEAEDFYRKKISENFR